jgi:hypothetical protein
MYKIAYFTSIIAINPQKNIPHALQPPSGVPSG